MALDPVVNFFRSTIATLPLNSGTTTMVLASGDGNKLPDPSVDGAFNLVVYDPSDPFVAPEIVRCTARTSDTLTISRGQEGTSDATKAAGIAWTVELVPTAKTIQDIDSTKVNVADIVDNLTSTDTNKPLSANQGKVLQDGKVATASIVNDLTSGGTTVPLSAEQGKVLQDGKVAKAGDTMTGTLTATKLIPSGNVTAGNGMYLPATNQIAIGTNGAERVRVNASGDVVIGAPSVRTTGALGAAQLTLEKSTFSSFQMFGNQNGVDGSYIGMFKARGGTVGGTTNVQENDFLGGTFFGGYADGDFRNAGYILAAVDGSTISSTSMPTRLVFATTPSGSPAMTERLRITSAGDVGIGNTAPASKLHVTGLTRSTSGINFNASGGNTLDSYEEGTWTPVWAFSTSGSVTLSVDYARYTRIGNIVNVRAGFFTTAISSPVGDATITGLPFAHAETGGRDCPGTIATLLRWNTDMPNLNMCIGSGSVLNFRKNATNSESLTSLLGSDFSATSGNRNVISISITYRV
jgi:hypothetical protein